MIVNPCPKGIGKFRPLFVLVSFAILFAGTCLAQEKNYKEIRRSAERRYLGNDIKRIKRYEGDYSIKYGDEVDANIVITGGDLEIDGEITGTVIVIDGDIIVNSRGVIRGDAIAISGAIIRRTGAVIFGDEIQTSWRNFVERSDRLSRRWARREDIRFQFNDDNRFPDMNNEDVLVRYNRVEGLFLGTDLVAGNMYRNRFLNIYGNAGYGFKSRKWRFVLGLEKRAFDNNEFTVGVKGFDLTESDDNWRIGLNENSLAAVFLKEDFLDFYNRKGVSAYVSQTISNSALIKFEYASEEYFSMPNKANWSMFGGDKKFRLNPAISEGKARGISFLGIIDTRSGYGISDKGWWVRIDSEYRNPDFGGDFNYERHIVDIRRYQPLSRFENLNFRLMFGSSRGTLPLQRRFFLGGISTLRGLKYKELTGTSMFLGNIEYLFDPERLLSNTPAMFLEDFKIALFFDIGATFDAVTSEYIDKLNIDILKHNVGVGLTTYDEDLRVDFAWQTDVPEQKLRVTFRLNRSF